MHSTATTTKLMHTSCPQKVFHAALFGTCLHQEGESQAWAHSRQYVSVNIWLRLLCASSTCDERAPLCHSDTALLPDLQGAAKGHPCRKGTHATQSYRQLAQSTDLKQTRIHDSQTSVFVVIKCCSEAMLSADTAYQLSVLLLRNTWKNTYTLP